MTMPPSADDPERRIADLERALSTPAADVADPAVSAPPKTGAGMRIGWILLGLLIAGLVAGGGAILVDHSHRTVAGNPLGPRTERSVGPTAKPSGAPRPPTRAPSVVPVPPSSSEEPRPGSAIIVSGTGNDRTINCADNHVSVSGVENTVRLTGHCSQVSVSGVDNTVTIDEAEAIVVSGVRNKVTYLSGSPHLNKSGFDNTLGPG